MPKVNNHGKKLRKRHVLSIKEKLDIIKKHGQGASATNLAKFYDIGIQTVRDIVKSKEKLESFVARADSFTETNTRKSLKGSMYKDLDSAMVKWFLQKRAEGVPVSGPMCTQQAQFFCDKLHIEEKFCASSGWLHRFKKRHGIRELSIQGEKLSADEVAIVEFCYDLECLIKEHDLKLDQIYNADETGLYWRAMPTRTLAAGNETNAPGYKANKDRLTILCCANASGKHKLKLAMIGKSKNPRALKNINKSLLPVSYYNQSAGWMNADIFKDWFFKKFVPEVRDFLTKNNLPAKAVLLLDNAPSHPSADLLKSSDGNIFVYFFPPNVTSIAQPMDQGIIEAMKRLYRKDIMMKLLADVDINSFWKNLNIKDAIYAVSRAWDGVKDLHIQRAFSKIMTLNEIEVEEVDTVPELSTNVICTLAQQVKELTGIEENEIDEWLHCDAHDLGVEMLNDEEIISKMADPTTSVTLDENSAEESREAENEKVKVSHSEAERAVNIVLKYFEEQSNSDDAIILNIKKIKETIKSNSLKTKAQSRITDFFK